MDQRVSNLHLCSMWNQVIVDLSREDRRLNGHHPGLRKRLCPGIQCASRQSGLAFLVDMTSPILHAKSERFLVNIKSDRVPIAFEQPLSCFLNQRPLSSAFF